MRQQFLIDSHNHTHVFSPDALQSPGELVEDALTAGLSGLAVTEHYDKDLVKDIVLPGLSPVGSPAAPDEWIFDVNEYFELFYNFKEQLASEHPDFILLSGIELGYHKHLAEALDDLVRSRPFDTVIGSVHALDGKDIYHNPDLSSEPKNKLYARYIETMIELVDHLQEVDILAHFDFIARVCDYEDSKMYYREHPDHWDTLFRKLIEKGVSLEINTRSRYRSLDSTGTDPGFPDSAIIQRYLELGGELITPSSDAHRKNDSGRLLQETAAWLQSLGVRYLTYYVKRKPQFIALN